VGLSYLSKLRHQLYRAITTMYSVRPSFRMTECPSGATLLVIFVSKTVSHHHRL